MAKVYIHSKSYIRETETHYFSITEVFFLKSFHPVSLFLSSVGYLWFTYYLWNHDWPLALGMLVITRLLAVLAVWDVSPQKMSETFLGKIALLHLHPVNLFIQFAGVVLFFYGVWWHSLEFILGGLTLILCGHLFGWAKVDPHYAVHNTKNF